MVKQPWTRFVLIVSLIDERILLIGSSGSRSALFSFRLLSCQFGLLSFLLLPFVFLRGLHLVVLNFEHLLFLPLSHQNTRLCDEPFAMLLDHVSVLFEHLENVFVWVIWIFFIAIDLFLDFEVL